MKTVIASLFALGFLGLAFIAWLSHRDAAEQRVVPAGAAEGAESGPGGVAGPAAARGRGRGIPRFSDIAGFVMAYRVGRVPLGRIAVLGSWWWVGWHFFAR
jgi:hypothetical protein